MAKDASSGALLAMVALNAETLPNPGRLLAALEEMGEDCPPLDDTTHEEDSIVFRLGTDMVAISLMPAPIPWSDLEGPCATAWWWPDAAERMSQHTHHLIIALLGGTESPLERHIRLTRIIAASADSAAVGIYYCPGTVVHDPAVFQEEAARIDTENIEPQLWIDMRLGQNDDNTLRLFTTGMETFGHPEIEIDRSRRQPDEILNFCYTIVNYLLTSDVHLKDGETIGRSAQEKIKVRFQPSMWERGTVMKLAFT